MDSRKKKKGYEKNESEDGLHKDETLLEYQNKCLCVLVDDLREKLKTQEENYRILERKNNRLFGFLNDFDRNIRIVNDSICLALKENNIELEEKSEGKNVYFSGPVELLKEALNFSSSPAAQRRSKEAFDPSKMETEEENDDKIKGAKDKTKEKEEENNKESVSESENIVQNSPQCTELFKPIEETKASVSKLIDVLIKVLKVNKGNLSKKYVDASKEILEKNSKFEEKIKEKDVEILGLRGKINEILGKFEEEKDKRKRREKEVEEVRKEMFKYKRIASSHPKMPYLYLIKKVLNNETDDNHTCVCSICGKDLELKNKEIEEKLKEISSQSQVKSDTNKKEEEEDKDRKSEKKEVVNLDDDEKELIVKENEGLKKLILELHEKLKDSQEKNEITEENLIQSKCFQALISQAENLLVKFDKMKEINVELQRKNNSISMIKDDEMNELKRRFDDKASEFERKSLESIKVIEKNKNTIQMLMSKIEAAENLIKSKEGLDSTSVYDMFTQQRDNLLKQMESIKNINRDYYNKYMEERTKNKQNEEKISRLENEVLGMRGKSGEGSVNKHHEHHEDSIFQSYKDKIEYYKVENEKMISELNSERNNYEKMMEMNEEGINNLNALIKNFKVELLESKKKLAKLTDYKLKRKRSQFSKNKLKTIKFTLKNLMLSWKNRGS